MVLTLAREVANLLVMIERDPAIDVLRKRLRDRPRGLTLNQIAAATGLGKPWLKAFLEGRTQNPAYERIRALERFFQERERMGAGHPEAEAS